MFWQLFFQLSENFWIGGILTVKKKKHETFHVPLERYRTCKKGNLLA